MARQRVHRQPSTNSFPTTSTATTTSIPIPTSYSVSSVLLRRYSEPKRLLFYDLFFCLYFGPLLLLTFVCVYLPYRILSYIIPSTGNGSRRVLRQATLSCGGVASVFLLILICNANSPTWSTAFSWSFLDHILIGYENTIDRSCGWAQRRILNRHEYNALLPTSKSPPPPTGDGYTAPSPCIPHFCPNTFAFFHQPDPYLVLSFRDPSSPRFIPNISAKEVHNRLRQATRIYHPDKRSIHNLPDRHANAILGVYQDAAETLLDKQKRKSWEHDHWLDTWIMQGKAARAAVLDRKRFGVEGVLRKLKEKQCETASGQRGRKIKQKIDDNNDDNERVARGRGLAVEILDLLIRWWRWWGSLLWTIGSGVWILIAWLARSSVGLPDTGF